MSCYCWLCNHIGISLVDMESITNPINITALGEQQWMNTVS